MIQERQEVLGRSYSKPILDSKAWRSLPEATDFMEALETKNGDLLTEVWATCDQEKVVMIFALIVSTYGNFRDVAEFVAGVEGIDPAGLSKRKVWQIATGRIK